MSGLASDFCHVVADAAGTRPFGVTSHYRAKARHPDLPWAAFFQRATVLLPQAYWRVDAGTVGHGDPAENYAMSIKLWKAAGGEGKRIVPMAGELHKITAMEIASYAAKATAEGVDELHFYADRPEVNAAVRAAVDGA